MLCGGWHTVSLPIERVPGMLMKRRVAEEGGESAVTHYRILKTGTAVEAPLSLAEFTIDTGRTHQIRVHMAHLGTRSTEAKNWTQRRSRRCFRDAG